MSGSYYNLLSKYNTLYALYLKLQNSSSSTDLSGVLNAGNTADNDIILTDTTFYNTITKTNILLETDVSVANPTPEVYIETIVKDSLSAKFALAFINSYVDAGNYFAGMVLQNDTSNLTATSKSLDISGVVGSVNIDPSYGITFTNLTNVGKLTNEQVFFTDGTDISTYKRLEMKLDDGQYSNTTTQNDIFFNDSFGTNVKLTKDKLEFNTEKGIYSIGNDLTIACPQILDISINGLSINGVQGDLGDIIISNGSGLPPSWSGINNVICNGSIAMPGDGGLVFFSSFSANFSYVPTVILTVISGDTNTYIANVISVTRTQFTYTISGNGSGFLNFIAI